MPNIVIRKTSWLAVLLGSVLAAAAALSNPALAQSAPATAAVTVNGIAIAQDEVERLVRREVGLGRKDDAALRARIREKLIVNELLYQEALRRKLDQSPGFKAAMREAERNALTALVIASAKAPVVSDSDVRAAYDQATARLARNDMLLRAIVVADNQSAQKVWAELARGGEFERLAQLHSILPSGKVGGSLGWVNLRKDDSANEEVAVLAPSVVSAARKLAKGGLISPTPDSKGRWWIVKLIDIRPRNVADFNKVAPQIRKSLERAARARASQSIVADLRKTAKIR
jgi:peptidyl-prolyl cis-trans isomerase C